MNDEKKIAEAIANALSSLRGIVDEVPLTSEQRNSIEWEIAEIGAQIRMLSELADKGHD